MENKSKNIKPEIKRLDHKKDIESEIEVGQSSFYLLASYFILIIIFCSSTISPAIGQVLKDYQQLAVANNPGLQAKYKAFEASLQQVTLAKGFPDPTFSVSAFGRMVETRVGPQKARFTLSQMFPWFGTLKTQGDVATLMAEASFQRYLDEQNLIRFQVAKAYFPLLELEEVIVILRENLELLNSWKILSTAKFENGKTSLSDVLRVDLMIQEMETEILLLEQMNKPLTAIFNKFLNRPDSISVFLRSGEKNGDTPVLSNEIDWSAHPLLKELDLKIQSREKQYMAIEKQSLPKIGLGLDYIIVGERTDMSVPNNGQDAIMPMVSVSLPIFRKKYKAALKETKLQSESFELMAQSTRNDLNATYENLKYDIQKELQLIDLFDSQIEETKQIQNLLTTEFSNSGKDLVELLRIQMQLLNFQKLLVKSKTKLQTALANMEYVTAGVN